MEYKREDINKDSINTVFDLVCTLEEEFMRSKVFVRLDSCMHKVIGITYDSDKDETYLEIEW